MPDDEPEDRGVFDRSTLDLGARLYSNPPHIAMPTYDVRVIDCQACRREFRLAILQDDRPVHSTCPWCQTPFSISSPGADIDWGVVESGALTEDAIRRSINRLRDSGYMSPAPIRPAQRGPFKDEPDQ